MDHRLVECVVYEIVWTMLKFSWRETPLLHHCVGSTLVALPILPREGGMLHFLATTTHLPKIEPPLQNGIMSLVKSLRRQSGDQELSTIGRQSTYVNGIVTLFCTPASHPPKRSAPT